MKYMKGIIFFVFFVLLTMEFKGQSTSTTNILSDKAYEELFNILREEPMTDTLFFSKDIEQNIRYIQIKQSQLIHFRDAGLKFWKNFPKDSRKYQWLSHMALIDGSLYFGYWKDVDQTTRKAGVKSITSRYSAPLDWERLKEWEQVYPTLKKEFLAYYNHHTDLLKYDYYTVLIGELSQFLSLSMNMSYRENEKIDIPKLKRLFLATAPILSEDTVGHYRTSVTNLMDNNFLAVYKHYGLTDKDLSGFIYLLKQSKEPEIQNWAVQRATLLALKKEPFQLKHEAIDGREIDLANLRGNVVLLDFWATWCTSCIARMPAIKQVYDKYKDLGFTVISISLNQENDLDKVKLVKEKIGADWPILIIGGKSLNEYETSLGSKIWNKYGLSGVPQLLLLNKKGELVVLNDELRYGDFEPIVKTLLSQNY
jgi:thiol-disulfide isomerase/thioredoxin